jgi:ubiquitin carboxyl-terminal hydrolase 8
MSYTYDITKGYTGLQNLGNTCFLNSCMQALSHTYELTYFLQSDKYKQHLRQLTDNVIINEWVDLHNVMWSQNGIVSPKRFVHNVQQLAEQKDRELFTGWAQNDLPEFLLFLIECMHNSIARPVRMNIKGNVKNNTDKLATACYKMLKQTYSKEYSEIMEMFYGIYVSELSSINKKTVYSYRPENFFILDLEIPSSNCSLYDCFSSFTSYETLDGDNSWYNEEMNKKIAVKKRITFWSLPKILIITLKRFSFDGKKKRQEFVDIPLTDFSLSKYVSGYNAKQYKYDLYAVCNHSGNTQGGHYTAYVKTNTSWTHYNDSQVERNISENKIITPKAYCLFYRKK